MQKRSDPTFTGGVLHYDGHGLTARSLGIEVDSISGSGADDVWIPVGSTQSLGDFHLPCILNQEYVMRYDGKDWRRVPGPQLLNRRGSQIIAFGRGDVWLRHAQLDHLEGDSWTEYIVGDSFGTRIRGTDPRHFWWFGGDRILRYLP